MSDWLSSFGLADFLTPDRVIPILRAVVVLVVGFALARIVSATVVRGLAARLNAQEAMILRRFVYYGLFGLALAMALHQVGFNLGVLLGAAGILTVALGFASQTSASNLISGLFLIAERPFVVGDVVRMDDVTGEVLTIDLLSVKLRTFDNLLVRVPNENIIKSRITNLSRFPIRRADLIVGVAYKENLPRVREVLFDLARANPLCLDEPEPLFLYKGFGESSVDIQFSVWSARENYLELKNDMTEGIKAAFDREGIEIPFPHRTIYAGAVTEPIPVRMVPPSGGGAGRA